MSSSKITAVIGASPNPDRYAFIATNMLRSHGHQVFPLGKKAGNIGEIPIITNWPEYIPSLHTVTMYVGSANQTELLPYIIALSPKRIIFNPGTENPNAYPDLEAAGIEVEEACTLVLLSTGQF